MPIPGDMLVHQLREVIPEALSIDDIMFFCVGTDRSTGDSLGPLTGTSLIKLGIPNVLGTLNDPVHAENLSEKLKLVDPKLKIIAIDACLGQASSVGEYQAAKGPLRPGAGVNKDLPPVGDYHITGIVNVGGFMEYFVLQNTRLRLVMDMAQTITDAILDVFTMNQGVLAEVAVSNDN